MASLKKVELTSIYRLHKQRKNRIALTFLSEILLGVQALDIAAPAEVAALQ